MWQHLLTSVSRQSGPPSPRVRNVRRPAIINLFSPPPSLRHACPSFRLLRYEIETRGQIHVSVAQHLHVFLHQLIKAKPTVCIVYMKSKRMYIYLEIYIITIWECI